MLALAQAGHKHKIGAETVVPQLQRAPLMTGDDAGRGRHVERLRRTLVRQRHCVKQLNLAALEQTRDLFTRLSRVGRTRDVAEHATGARQSNGPIEQLAL